MKMKKKLEEAQNTLTYFKTLYLFCTYSTHINVELFVCNLKSLLSPHTMTFSYLAKVLIKYKIIFFSNLTPRSLAQYIGTKISGVLPVSVFRVEIKANFSETW